MFAWWWRDAGTLAERQREGPLSQQRGRGFLAGSRGERTRDSGGWRGFLVGNRGERMRDSGGSRGRVVFSTGWQWWRSEMESTGWQWWRSEMEEEKREMVAGIAERGGEKLQRELRARGRKGLQF